MILMPKLDDDDNEEDVNDDTDEYANNDGDMIMMLMMMTTKKTMTMPLMLKLVKPTRQVEGEESIAALKTLNEIADSLSLCLTVR